MKMLWFVFGFIATTVAVIATENAVENNRKKRRNAK